MNQIMPLFMCCSYKINEFIQLSSECAYAEKREGGWFEKTDCSN